MFEKYGSDSIKRSLNNQLTSHLMFNQLVENNIATPIFIWRALVGSVHPYIALSVSFVRNTALECTYDYQIECGKITNDF